MLIGLGYQSRVGKDAVADLLVKHHGFRKVSFGDPIKEFTYRTHPEVRRLVDTVGWETAKDAYPSVVQTLVDVGKAARDVMGEDVWIRAVLDGAGVNVVNPSVRYPNECHAIHERRGLLVKVTRPGVCPLDTVTDHALDDFDGWDAVIANDGTLDDLRVQLDELLARVAAAR